MSTNKRVKKPSPDLAGLHQLLSKDELGKRLNLDRQATQYQHLLNKSQVAARLQVTVRGLEGLMAKRIIPFYRVSGRLVRFDFARVQEALRRFEIREIGR